MHIQNAVEQVMRIRTLVVMELSAIREPGRSLTEDSVATYTLAAVNMVAAERIASEAKQP